MADNGDFSISDDGSDASCKPSKVGFDCAFEPVDLKLAGINSHTEATMHIKWTSADRFEGTLTIDSECTGAGCAALIEDLSATLTPMLTTCAAAPDVDLTQSLRIEPAVNGVDDAQIFVNDDPTPHDCTFSGEGRVSCFRLTFDGDVKQFAQVSGSWTSATSFEGEASLELTCDDGKDCAGNALGLPCVAFYQLSASGDAASAP